MSSSHEPAAAGLTEGLLCQSRGAERPYRQLHCVSCSHESATGMQAWLGACSGTTHGTHHPCNAMYSWCICAFKQEQHDWPESILPVSQELPKIRKLIST